MAAVPATTHAPSELPPNVIPASDLARVLELVGPAEPEEQRRTHAAVKGLLEIAGTIEFHEGFDTDKGRWFL